MRLLPLLLTVVVSLSAAPAAAAPETLTPRELADALAEYNRFAHGRLPTLRAEELDELLRGDVVRRKLRGKGGAGQDRVLGIVLTRLPRVQPWIVVTDPHFATDSQYAGKKLDPPGTNPTRSYGLLDLPWPVADRHWVVDVSTNQLLSQKTGGRCWERYWDLTKGGEGLAPEVYTTAGLPGTDPAKLAEVIYTPVNSGSWVFIALPRGFTLVAYQLATQVGGDIPEEALHSFALQAMGQLMRGILGKAEGVAGHYDAAHVALPGGDGAELPRATP